MCIAHNFKGYDSYFILKYLYDNKVRLGFIMNGGRVRQLVHRQFEISPHSTVQVTQNVWVDRIAKGYFPHFFNTKANQKYVGPLPDARYCDLDGMKPEAREAFYKWYTQCKKQVVLNMEDELLK